MVGDQAYSLAAKKLRVETTYLAPTSSSIDDATDKISPVRPKDPLASSFFTLCEQHHCQLDYQAYNLLFVRDPICKRD